MLALLYFLLLQAAPATGQFVGTVTDVAGKPLPNATIILTDFRADRRHMTSTDTAGEFQFPRLPAATYVADVLSAVQTGYKNQGYEEGHASITIQSGERTQRDFKLRLVVAESAQSRPDLYALPQRNQRPMVTVGDYYTDNFLLQRVEPANPSNVTGTVRLQVRIDVGGKVTALRIVRPDADPTLARAAIQAVQQWVYRPVTGPDSAAREALTTVDVLFRAK